MSSRVSGPGLMASRWGARGTKRRTGRLAGAAGVCAPLRIDNRLAGALFGGAGRRDTIRKTGERVRCVRAVAPHATQRGAQLLLASAPRASEQTPAMASWPQSAPCTPLWRPPPRRPCCVALAASRGTRVAPARRLRGPLGATGADPASARSSSPRATDACLRMRPGARMKLAIVAEKPGMPYLAPPPALGRRLVRRPLRPLAASIRSATSPDSPCRTSRGRPSAPWRWCPWRRRARRVPCPVCE